MRGCRTFNGNIRAERARDTAFPSTQLSEARWRSACSDNRDLPVADRSIVSAFVHPAGLSPAWAHSAFGYPRDCLPGGRLEPASSRFPSPGTTVLRRWSSPLSAAATT